MSHCRYGSIGLCRDEKPNYFFFIFVPSTFCFWFWMLGSHQLTAFS